MAPETRETVLITENCGPLGKTITYIKKDSSITRKEKKEGYIKNSLLISILNIFRELLLPAGYPHSVSDDYLEYQIWDTIQAFCSTITGIFTTHAILKGVGVGNAKASALSATIAWIFKDGAGMIGRIVFAWWKGNNLDSDCKKWRLFADFINDSAMLLELTLPYFVDLNLPILCVSMVLKSLVGVAGGATRASISNHQAIKSNMAEISAKDGSQETIVNLIASITGLFLINHIKTEHHQWIVVGVFMSLHLYANYRAVCALIFNSLNNARIDLILKRFLEFNAVLGPNFVNKEEAVFLGVVNSRICDDSGFTIRMGRSIQSVVGLYEGDDLKSNIKAYQSLNFLLLTDLEKRVVYVSFGSNETADDVIAGYYGAVLLGIAMQMYNNVPLRLSSKRQLQYSTPLTRLKAFIKGFYCNTANYFSELPAEIHSSFVNDFLKAEINSFFIALKVNGWKCDTHALYLDEWRCDWKCDQKKSL